MTDEKLYAKMSKVMGMVNRVPKSGYNDHFKYAYATSEDVADVVREAMAEVGLAFFVDIKSVIQENKKTITDFEFTFADGESGATRTCSWRAEAQDSQDKGISKSATSAVKYFLLKTFLISTGDEPDPDSGGEPKKAKKEAKKEPVIKAQPEQPKQERPYPPDVVRKRLADRAAQFTPFIPTEPQSLALRMALINVFAGDDDAEDKRHVLLNYLSGSPSTKDTGGPLFKVIYEDWLKVKEKDGVYYNDPMAVLEAKAIVAEA